MKATLFAHDQVIFTPYKKMSIRERVLELTIDKLELEQEPMILKDAQKNFLLRRYFVYCTLIQSRCDYELTILINELYRRYWNRFISLLVIRLAFRTTTCHDFYAVCNEYAYI